MERLTAEERMILIQAMCQYELSDLDPANLDVVRVCIISQIKEAERAAIETLLSSVKDKKKDDSQPSLIRVRRRARS